ncbi:unnamed protein product [Mytilus edulis]|uniref:CCHC-type domain-containing protein n=1 Tax=Mytilus edulis TaxID=6550 RepID=A0A8S3RQ75_MYTED|nr:unnamed protein product [Mytilus edulis]
MSNVRFLKGVRTRYRNSIQTEILNGKQILSSEVDKLDEQRFVLEATKCADKLKMYSEKLEIQSGKLASALEDEGEVIDDIVGEDCELCSSVMDCYLDLIQFKERLVDFIKKESIEVKENEFSSQIVELQREMKDIMQKKAKDSVKPNGFGNKFSPKPWKTNSFNNNRSENCVYQPKSSAEALIANSSKSQPGSKYFDKCRYCGSKHWSDECQKFKTIEERKRQLKGSCFKCLKAGHGSFECKRNKLCIHCNEVNSHHRSLCPKKFNTKNTCVYLSEEISEYCSDNVLQEFESTNNESEQESSMLAFGEMVLMQTATAEITNPNYTKKEKTRILFDSGSQRTYISQRLASKLGLKSYHEEEISIIANIVPVISGCLNRRKLDSVSMTKLKKYVNDIYLADDLPFENESSEIDLLIGNDYYLDLILARRLEVQPGLYLLASKLGWMVTGRVKDKDNQANETGLLIMSHTNGNELKEQKSISKKEYGVLSSPDLTDFWKLESIGITDQTDNTDDEIAMKIFKDTLTFEKDGIK